MHGWHIEFVLHFWTHTHKFTHLAQSIPKYHLETAELQLCKLQHSCETRWVIFYTWMIDVHDKTNEKLNSAWHRWIFVSKALWERRVELNGIENQRDNRNGAQHIRKQKMGKKKTGDTEKDFRLWLTTNRPKIISSDSFFWIAMNFHCNDDKMRMWWTDTCEKEKNSQ